MSKIQCFNNGLSYDKDNDLIQDGDGDNHEIRLHYRLLIFVVIKSIIIRTHLISC